MTVRQLTKELKEKAQNEFNENSEISAESLVYIKKWLEKQNHIISRKDDQWLIAFLRGSKFSMERTKEKLDMYYTIKTLTPELFKNRDPLLPEIQQILNLGIFLPLPVIATPTSPRVIIIRTGFYDETKILFSNILKVSTMIQDILMLEDDVFTISGIIILQDLNKTGSLANLSFPLLKKAFVAFQHAYPNRIKGLHFINPPMLFETINNFIQLCLTNKLKQRMSVNSNINKIYKIIPKNILPKDYGGQKDNIENITKIWKKKVENYRQWFLDDEKFHTDETKRPDQQKDVNTIFGLDGSFRQLSFD